MNLDDFPFNEVLEKAIDNGKIYYDDLEREIIAYGAKDVTEVFQCYFSLGVTILLSRRHGNNVRMIDINNVQVRCENTITNIILDFDLRK